MTTTGSHLASWVAVSMLIGILSLHSAAHLAAGTRAVSSPTIRRLRLAAAGAAVAVGLWATSASGNGTAADVGLVRLDLAGFAVGGLGGIGIWWLFRRSGSLGDRRSVAARDGEALKESENRFRLLVDGVADHAIFMLDPTGHLTNWNSGAHRIKGYADDEIVGRHFSVFYTPEDREAGVPKRALEAAERTGKFEAEGWRVRKDGRRFWASVVINAIRDDAGRLIGFAKVTRDTTERREAQQKLEEARNQLMQVQKMEAIGQLTGGVAHDFNNLLAVIIGNLDLLRKRIPDDPKLVRLVETAMKGAERGAALTQRMLSFARRQDLKPEAVDVPNLVRDMADLLQRSIGPAVEIETRFPLRLPRAHVDGNQLELALVNLAVNARDAMPEGGTLTISASEETIGEKSDFQSLEPGRYMRLSVADTGHGMAPEVLERAMEPFFTTKGVGKGTGLGLSMVHGLAAQSGGRLILTSTPGRGTTAEIWLPVEASPAAAESVTPLSPETARDVDPAGRLRILVVDDDALVLMATVAMLEDLGHEVEEAASGREALERLAGDCAFDLVLTDEAMPGMTGTQLAAQIRTRCPDLPVVLGTGYAELPTTANHDLPRITKPFDQAALARAIGRVLEGGVPDAPAWGTNVVLLKHPPAGKDVPGQAHS